MIILLLLLVGSSLATQRINYENYQVIRAIPTSEKSLRDLYEFVKKQPHLTYWKEPSNVGSAVDIMVSPKYKNSLEHFLKVNGIKSNIFIPDVGQLINEEKSSSGNSSAFGWDQYHTLDEINTWLQNLTERFDEVKLIIIGRTYEGRNLTGVHISFSPNNSDRAVFVESNIHAEEWITSAVSTFILNEILTSNDSDVRKMAESYDWYFLPVANPDGFVYSHEVDRTWRKTRTPYARGLFYGADPNRNWDNHWHECGASSEPWSGNYAGPYPFSEICTKTMSEYLSTIGEKLVAYFDFHSYSQLLMVPYGYSPLPLDNYNLTYNIGLDAVKSLAKRYGTQYTVGNIYNTIYPASGSSADWVKASFRTPLVYAYELRDTGRYGFILPPDQIIPTSLETLDSIVTILRDYEETRNELL
ncbi:hypothetical protein HHI36_011920 [Cryptolaemus montrouzieri]|uniref:Zinc carboxypeptidase A 1 n=1 Tax=Cryptolaemus montrouzieri TaxID=559131 RepID=A0ABD2NDM6_9CUCU